MIRMAAVWTCAAFLSGPALAAAQEDMAAPPQIETGNGERNAIRLEGATRSGATFTFPSVRIERDGFLVMHPFRDGAPVPTEYVGAAPVLQGISHDVGITINAVPETGEMFIVMLHYDMNEDRIFDFNDGVTVPDAPVFEGDRLIALRYAAPEDSGE
ncbi:hypothetical protein HFP57_13545 [Parasphingopyxis algicola]|uniref:DUF7282 domain-containing protein n=1 Tax=Parasphingopyxis algicola TaxID=2026624 RepID=UPI0015A1AD43|nr:hypothetical protein [Parasphingopyxis algicola]QLC25947.1 hypothetical protein HFP57_13545 [Parasphingopyxis algicola]